MQIVAIQIVAPEVVGDVQILIAIVVIIFPGGRQAEPLAVDGPARLPA